LTRVKQIFCIYIIIVRLEELKPPKKKTKKNRTMQFREIFQKKIPDDFLKEIDHFFFINLEQDRFLYYNNGNRIIKYMSLVVLYTNFTTEELETGINVTNASAYFLAFPQLVVIPIRFNFKNKTKIYQKPFTPFILCLRCSPKIQLFFPLT